MESTLVSARVPVAKKESGARILASIGATTSDLINNAFDYVLSRKELPLPVSQERRGPEDFARFVDESTLSIAWNADLSEGDYKSMMRDRRLADYESLA